MKTYAKTPSFLQTDAAECGAASLAMIMAYHAEYAPLKILKLEPSATDGVNAADIMRAAKRAGLDCHGYRKEPEEIKKFDMPCIIHWNFNHFVVLEGFKGNDVFLNDPAVGRRKLTWDEFDHGFTGVVLTFKRKEKES